MILFKSIRYLKYTIDDLLNEQSFPKMLQTVEQRIGHIIGNKPCYIIWNSNKLTLDWKRGFYLFVIDSHIDLDRHNPSRITLNSEYGENEYFFYYPIAHDGLLYGTILLPLGRKKSIPSKILGVLDYFINILIYQFHLFRSKEDTKSSVMDELQKKVAQDMHDGVAQKLFFLSAQLYTIKENMSSRISSEEMSQLEQMSQNVEDSLVHVRNYMYHLRDSDREGDLTQNLQKLIAKKSTSSGIEMNLHTIGKAINESREILKTIYHIVDEATTNVIKHAKATKVDITLEVTPIQWSIRVSDNGIGIKRPQRKYDRLGLKGMEERIQQVGGFLTILTDKEIGTELISIIPRNIN